MNKTANTHEDRSIDHSTKSKNSSKKLNHTSTEYSEDGDMRLLKAKQTYYAMKNDATLLSNRIAMLQSEENKLLKKI